jgi:hypothetical protein
VIRILPQRNITPSFGIHGGKHLSGAGAFFDQDQGKAASAGVA